MRSFVLGASAAALAAGDSLSLSFTDCGGGSTPGTVTGLTPSSIALGSKSTVTGSGTLTGETVAAGTFEIDLKASIISQQFTGDLCSAKSFDLPLGTGKLAWVGVACPLSAGAVQIPVDVTLSASLPTALQNVELKISGADSSAKKLLCMDIKTAPAALAVADPPESHYQELWKQFKTDYNKEYPANGNDEAERYKVFKANVKIIENHNAQELSYTLGVNKFADLTWDEFAATHLGYNASSRFGNLPKQPFPHITDVADSIDWVAKGAVTPVKNQEQCGSCWAFSTTGAIEGAYYVASGKLESLSEEDLVQCDHNGDQGCSGGLMDNAFSWVSENGICSESSYPYTSGSGRTGTCQTGCSPVVTITGHTDVPARDEEALKAAVSKQPVSVAIEADKSAFQLYSSGVLDSSSCGTNLDHGVLVVGYGTGSGKDYWKVKNSWGASWGEEGYIRMVRNKNMCGISQQPSYPTGAKAASGKDIVV